jgi:hypothetical protein
MCTAPTVGHVRCGDIVGFCSVLLGLIKFSKDVMDGLRLHILTTRNGQQGLLRDVVEAR